MGFTFQAEIVKTKAVQEALLKVDRGNYVLNKDSAYDDNPQSLGSGQTISAPHMHAHVLEELLPTLVARFRNKENIHVSTNTTNDCDAPNSDQKDLRVLDVGCGSGYLSSCFGRLLQSKNSLGLKGKVFGIDILPKLVKTSKFNAAKADDDLIQSKIVSFQIGDGWKGLPSEAPFDIIHVGAAAADFPTELMSQLVVGGRMVCPVGPVSGVQYLYRIDRVKQSGSNQFHQSDFVCNELVGVRYVPLVQSRN